MGYGGNYIDNALNIYKQKATQNYFDDVAAEKEHLNRESTDYNFTDHEEMPSGSRGIFGSFFNSINNMCKILNIT